MQVWRPYLRVDVNMLEKVERRFTKQIPEIKHLEYFKRLEMLNLTTLETRRPRYDLIEVLK